MKKLMMAFAIASMAVCSQGSVVYWSFTDVAVNNASGNYFDTAKDLSGMTAYLILSSNWDSADVMTSLGKAEDSRPSTTWSKSVYNTGTKQAQFTTGTLNNPESTLATGDQTFKIIISDGKEYWSSADLTAKVVGTTSDPTYTVAKVQLSAATALTQADFTSVPEPTSALLMLLGVAGLALKRKVA